MKQEFEVTPLEDTPTPKKEDENKTQTPQEAPKAKPTPSSAKEEEDRKKKEDLQQQMMDDLVKFAKDFNNWLYGKFYKMLGDEFDKGLRSLKDSFSNTPEVKAVKDKENVEENNLLEDENEDLDNELDDEIEMQELSSMSPIEDTTSKSSTKGLETLSTGTMTAEGPKSEDLQQVAKTSLNS
ncbi:hypothetical protein [Legionella cardiaca]|uniref:Uncharacterized protein n=1 Tax=Legionella cardiaca TaxID=1071983 RepID=A0ABY8ATE4_9GAMM|nr:hypothetical protein [Legionella cardiaca]WED43051.1 hypothetical protein PXX05_14310 [Legionella cardiaca]